MKHINQNKKILLQNDSNLPGKENNTEKSVEESHPKEIGGRTQGLEPTRYGDWEFKGRCIDF